MAPQGSLSLSAAPASGSGSSSLVTTQPASTGSSSVSGSESGESSSKSESSGESSSTQSSKRRRCRNKKNKKCLYDIKEIEYLHPDIKAILPPREGSPDAPADDKKGFFKFAEQITVKSVGIPDAITVGGDDNKRKAGLDTHFQLTSQTPDVMKYDRDFDLNH
jgi:hypothetical protein